jgi:hypothetical protein
MGSVSDRRRTNNREFFEFFDEKQASDGLMVIGCSKFYHDHSWLGAVPGISCYCAKQAIEAQKQAVESQYQAFGSSEQVTLPAESRIR